MPIYRRDPRRGKSAQPARRPARHPPGAAPAGVGRGRRADPAADRRRAAGRGRPAAGRAGTRRPVRGEPADGEPGASHAFPDGPGRDPPRVGCVRPAPPPGDGHRLGGPPARSPRVRRRAGRTAALAGDARRRPRRAASGLRDALHRLAGATGSASAWIAADTVFHATAVQAAGNTYLTALYEGVHTAVLAREYEHWVQTETEPTWLAPPAVQLLDLHRSIYDAVAAGDAEAARVAVLRHHQVMLEHLAAAPGMPPMA